MKMAKKKGNKKSDRVHQESSLVLFRLLAHHPYFIAGIAKARKKYRVPASDISEMLIWKNDHREKYHRLVADLAELTDNFDIPPQLYRAARQFTLDYVFLDRYDRPSSFVAGLNVITSSLYLKTIPLNPGSVYVEIIPGITSEREIKDNWEKIVGDVKQARKFGVPAKINPVDERVWELTVLRKPKLDSETVADQLRSEFPTRSFTYDTINKHRFNYRKALSKLRPVSS